MQESWRGSRGLLIAQLVRQVERFIASGLIRITPELYQRDGLRRRLTVALNMTKVVQHVSESIQFENTEHLEPVFDPERPVRSTADIAPWHTGKPCEPTARSHVNLCVFDRAWEASEAFELDRNPLVRSWAKNDHLGYDVLYIHQGVVRKYRPDFIVRYKSGKMLALETKAPTGRAEPRPGAVGRSRQPSRRLWPLDRRCFLQSLGHQGYTGEARDSCCCLGSI